MKKFLITMFLYIICTGISAQDSVWFKLQSDATFKTSDGKDYIVLEYEGKTATELYSMVKSNVMSLYKKPSEVMSEHENVSISIRAYSDCVGTKTITLNPRRFSAFYNLVIKFKDGKIRIDAPCVDNTLYDYHNQLDRNVIPSYPKLVKGWFSDGAPKEKAIERIAIAESAVNLPINGILGLGKEKEEEEW